MSEGNTNNAVKIILIVLCIIAIICGMIFIYFKYIKSEDKTNIDNTANKNYTNESDLNTNSIEGIDNELNINNTNDSNNNSDEIITDSNTAPTNNKNEKFSMKIEDIFTITGRGTVVTGRVESGSIRVNDTVQIIGTNNEIKTTVITSIEMFRKNSDIAETGDNVGLLLKGIEKSDVEIGQIIQSID